jgi:3-hydroxyacyl-CoA dehydrogenase/enoyl-CoA hydratase/3-hydroxybutyryl-CoA epimerase
MGVYYRVEGDLGFLEFDLPDSRVNLLTGDVMKRLDAILDEIKKNGRVKAILVMSKKKDVFIAGADIKEIDGITKAPEGEEKARSGQKILDKLEDLPFPTVAVIDGVALGGGCELVLACKYRLGTFNEKLKIGLPEVNLGIIPGFGGTYRLPKLIGLSQALSIILAGKVISGKDALKVGLVDRLVPSVGLHNSARQFVDEVLKNGLRRKKKKGMEAFLDDSPAGNLMVFSQARKNVLKQSKGFYPAPLRALEVIKKNLRLSRDRALPYEAKVFGELAITTTSKNLIQVFYLSEKFKKLLPAGGENVKPKEIHKCGVVGAGVMGGGIAQLLSYNNITVRLKDINYDAVAKGLQAASKVFQQAVKRRKLTKSVAQVKMANISGTIDDSGFKNVDAVIEAVVENLDIKKKVFQHLDTVVPPSAILCTNTSSLSVTEMAKATKDPSRVIGFHFFNPVHRMPLLEIITTNLTSPETVVSSLNLAKRLGKTPILVKDAPGFLVNRILLIYINEAGRLLEQGIPMEVIDKMMTDFGMPMGPFLLSDEVGLDIGVKVLHILHEGLGERFKPVDIYEQVLKKGLLGKKSGKGFYVHQNRSFPNREIYRILGRQPSGQLTVEEYRNCKNRMLFMMINEAARILEEGIVEDAGTVDIGMIMGTGFPPFRGGLLRYADQLGIENIVGILNRYAEKFNSDYFKPCDYLLKLQQNKKGFHS